MKCFAMMVSTIAYCAVAATGLGGRPATAPLDSSRLTLDVPKTGAKVTTARGSDGLVRFTVRGSWRDLPRSVRLLLWVRPTSPAGDGWYLQRPPVNGIGDVGPDGTWTGTAQVGSAQWPPRDGDEVEIAVTLIDKRDAATLFIEEGVVVRGRPMGTTLASESGIVIALR